MKLVTISAKFQVVIPKSIRVELELRPGQKVRMFLTNGQIVMIPVRSIKSMRGFLKGNDTTIERDADRV